MHISEGVLSGPVLATGAVLSLAGVAVGIRKLDYDQLPQAAVVASVFFVASLVHVPLGPFAAHLVLNGVCGLVLGWAAFPAILVGLTLQAVLFQFGGLTTLGVNTFNMAFPALVVWFFCKRFLLSHHPIVRGVAEFTGGAGAVLLSGLLVALCLILTGESFGAVAGVIFAGHIPIMIMEGIITVFIVEFLKRVKPEILD